MKITAERIALCGLRRSITFSGASAGICVANRAGRIAKYLATSFAIEKVVRAPRVISRPLPISTTSISLVGSESRSIMFAASLAAWVPLCMARPTSACARAGASFVPSPIMATSFPPRCSSRIMASLSSGVASARKPSTPASRAIASAVRGLSPVIITVRSPMRRSCSKRSRMPGFTTSDRATTPSTRSSRSTTRGVPPARATSSTSGDSSVGTLPPRSRARRVMRSAAPLRMLRPPASTPLMRVCAVNSTNAASAGAAGVTPCVRASVTMLLPSGVGSAAEASAATPASSSPLTPGSGRKRVA